MSPSPFKLEFFKFTRKPLTILFIFLLMVALKGVALLADSDMEGEEWTASGFVYLAKSAEISVFFWWCLALCAAASSWSGDRSRGILKMQLPRPVNREALFLARLVVFLVAIVVLLAVDAAVGIGLGCCFRQFGDVPNAGLLAPGEDVFTARGLAFNIFLAYLQAFVAMSATISIGIFFSVIATHPTSAILLAAGTGLAMEGTRMVLGAPVSVFMVTGYNCGHFTVVKEIAMGISEEPNILPCALIVPLVFFKLLNLVSLMILPRTDIME